MPRPVVAWAVQASEVLFLSRGLQNHISPPEDMSAWLHDSQVCGGRVEKKVKHLDYMDCSTFVIRFFVSHVLCRKMV